MNGKDNPIQLKKRRVWIIDPVDGTRAYSEPPGSVGPSVWPWQSMDRPFVT